MKTNPQKTDVLNKLQELIKEVNFGMLTTLEADGDLVSRPMTTQEMDKEGHIWFFSSRPSNKATQVQSNHHVNISYAHPDKQSYVSVSGNAYNIEDPEKKKQLWSPILKAWYPDGLDDPKLSLIKVEPTSAEYWDANSSKLVELFKIAKAIATGKQYESGEHKEVKL